jgi:hypothetical protein
MHAQTVSLTQLTSMRYDAASSDVCDGSLAPLCNRRTQSAVVLGSDAAHHQNCKGGTRGRVTATRVLLSISDCRGGKLKLRGRWGKAPYRLVIGDDVEEPLLAGASRCWG